MRNADVAPTHHYNDGQNLPESVLSEGEPSRKTRIPEVRIEDATMLDPKQLDDLVRRMSSAMPKGLQMLQEDINRNLRASLEAGLNRLDLVTREEFDVQSAVLARTREKVTQLEAQVAALEAALALRHPPAH